MYLEKRRAVILGVLFIVAAVTSIIGLVLYGPILNNPDYLSQGPTSSSQIVTAAIFELILAAAAIGTSITFFPLLKQRDETLALGYVTFRTFEAVLIALGVISMLTLVTLRQSIAAGELDASAVAGVGQALRGIHAWTMILGPNFMLGINTALYASLLYATQLVPRPLATLGLVGASSVFVAALLEMFGVIQQVSAAGGLLALPIAAFEMSLAVYLIVKGFKGSATVLRPAAAGAV